MLTFEPTFRHFYNNLLISRFLFVILSIITCFTRDVQNVSALLCFCWKMWWWAELCLSVSCASFCTAKEGDYEESDVICFRINRETFGTSLMLCKIYDIWNISTIFSTFIIIISSTSCYRSCYSSYKPAVLSKPLSLFFFFLLSKGPKRHMLLNNSVRKRSASTLAVTKPRCWRLLPYMSLQKPSPLQLHIYFKAMF